MIRATCPDCRWSVEADDRGDAHRASLNHWSSAHAQPWCRFCEHDTGGPQRNHGECEAYAVTSWGES